MPKMNRNPEDDNLEAPAKLVTALRELPRERVFIPPTLDETVLGMARKHLGGAEERPFDWFRLIPWAAAVAMLTLLLFLAQLFIKPASRAPRTATFAREDVNHDGRVDILDAFALARQLKSGTAKDLHLDVNRDGLIDERDVTAIA